MEIDTSVIHLREVMDLRFQNIELKFALQEKALELKARENEIHFDKLNHEYVRIDKVTSGNVSKEKFDTDMGNVNYRLSRLERVMYVAIGALLALEIVLKYFV